MAGTSKEPKEKLASLDFDLYEALDLDESVEYTEKEIVKAYRQRALKCHPDKNRDNPAAAEEFLRISQALEILCDAGAKLAYDNVRKARRAAEARRRQMDAKRQKFKTDLEERERQGQSRVDEQAQAQSRLQAEVERLRKDGHRLLREEQTRVGEMLRREAAERGRMGGEPARLKVKWKAAATDAENGGYSEPVVRAIFSRYGDLNAVVVSEQRKGSALVEFVRSGDAIAVDKETGLSANPWKLTWVSGKPDDTPQNAAYSEPPPGEKSERPTLEQDRDFESVVLMNLRRAEERRKLMEEMKEEEVIEVT